MADQQAETKIRIVKKKGGHGGAHGGAWKVAYADFVTAMMAFFLLMWLLNSANQNTKAGIAGMFQDPNFFNTQRGKEILANYGKGILPGGRGMAPGPDGSTANTTAAALERRALQSTADAIEASFTNDEMLKAFKDQIHLDFTDEGLRIQIQDKAGRPLFDSGSAKLQPYALSILQVIARELGKLRNRVVIGGHTDSQQYPNQIYTNWELSCDRANAARRALISAPHGLRPDQVRRVTGYADTMPMEGLDPQDPRNRRISIVVLSSEGEAAETRREKARPNLPASPGNKEAPGGTGAS